MEESLRNMTAESGERTRAADENLTACIRSALELKECSPAQFSPLTLAYIGDSIYDLVIKTYLLSKGNMPVNKLNRHASLLVRAQTQSEMIGWLESSLTEEEMAVYKRGRNAKSYTSAKNASIGDYRRATGFEALMGYLYLSGKYCRMMELIRAALTAFGELAGDTVQEMEIK